MNENANEIPRIDKDEFFLLKDTSCFERGQWHEFTVIVCIGKNERVVCRKCGTVVIPEQTQRIL